ncbi:MAG: hypothetical protein A3J71_10380 [Pseudomonadales bacterium RIFCSPHIGHO2_02_FULL_60_43]|nr:MAG: hypothetical protein A3J71_10380 [Pseudomonadales bacterium RIFCSPHIGHO2_02_FULL_60_43]
MSETTLVDLLSQVPNVVWSGVIASVITLTGVFISNASNTKRLRIQLSHDATEKSKERTGKLRQEVYLLVAEELGKVNNNIGSLASSDFTKDSALNEMSGLFSAVAKLQLVAEPSTAYLVSELNAKYGAAILRLIVASDPQRKTRIDIDIVSKSYEESLEQVKRYQGTISDMVDCGEVDTKAFEQLQKRHDFHLSQMNAHAQARNELWDIYLEKQLVFTKALISEMKPLSSQYVEALIAIRNDLGLPAERQQFESQMIRQWEVMEHELRKTIESLQASQE